MRALICSDYQGIDSLRVGELTEPVPGPGSVLVKIEATAVNFADTLMVKGMYQVRPETPFAPGYEMTGTVVVANQAAGLSPGDRVCGFHPYGGLAERAVLLPPNAIRVPDTIPPDIAAVLPATYGTSFHALVDRGRIESGETLLVLGAAGGVGHAAVQIGKALGAKVIAAVSSEEKAVFATEGGADHVIRYDREPLREAIAEITKGQGVDVVFDPVGGDTTEAALRSTRWNGRLLVIGFAAGKIPSVPLNLPLLKGNSVVGVYWGRFTEENPDEHRANSNQIIEWVENGTLKPRIQKEFGLEESPEALRWVEGRKVLGRVVVIP